MKAKLDKEKVKKLYLAGYNAPEIADIYGFKKDTVKKCIQRNFKHYELWHKRARFEKLEIEKATNYEATKCMSDSTFVKKNKSAYRTEKNGDIVANISEEELPWDAVRKLKNKNNKDLVEKRLMGKYKKKNNCKESESLVN